MYSIDSCILFILFIHVNKFEIWQLVSGSSETERSQNSCTAC